MLDQDNKIYNIIDWIILSFFVIFILSLSNSIFINQIGYFGALLFILLKIFLTRKNQFQKTGLELAFALYMIAEILSLIFSDYKAEALQNFSKRALLIPVFYTTITVTTPTNSTTTTTTTTTTVVVAVAAAAAAAGAAAAAE